MRDVCCAGGAGVADGVVDAEPDVWAEFKQQREEERSQMCRRTRRRGGRVAGNARQGRRRGATCRSKDASKAQRRCK